MNLQISYTSRLIYIYLYIITTLIFADEEAEEISYILHVGVRDYCHTTDIAQAAKAC